MFKKGKCTCKNFICTPDWKCVDFRINPEYSPEKAKVIYEDCRKTDYFDVCEWCRCFKGDRTPDEPVSGKKEQETEPAPDLFLDD